MPLLIDEDAKTVGTFDITTAQTLYWKAVPVVLRQPEREEQVESLTFRILSGYTRPNHTHRVLRIHISSEDDPFFLHTLEVSEDDFQTLKAEQGILVDFSNFPGKIITLLEKCLSAQQPDMPRFQAVLNIRTSDSIFKFVETNDFKQLPHITLSFRPGNDFAVKQFLAFRLQEVKEDYQAVCSELTDTKEDLTSSREQLADRSQRLASLKEQYDKQLLETQASAKTQQAAAHEERIREKGQLREQLERERQQAETKHREQVEALTARLAELDSDNRKLREAKYQLDTQVSELSHKLGSAEGAKRSLEEEAARLQAAHKAASQQRHDLDIQLNEAKAKLIALEEKAQAQAGIIEQQQLRLRDLEGSARQWEARCSDLREVLAGHEQRAKEAAAEVLKGNQIIEKLSSDLRLSKEKAKRKQAIILRQEEEVAAKEQTLAQAQRDGAAAKQEIEGLQADLAGVKSDNERLRARLDESKEQLTSNEQMIRWLNQQVTEAQLSMTTAVPGSSRYTFRPASTIATPAAGLLGAAPASTYPTRFTTPALGGASMLKTSGYHTTSSYSPRAGPTPLTSKINMMPSSSAGAAMGLPTRHLSPGKQTRSYGTATHSM